MWATSEKAMVKSRKTRNFPEIPFKGEKRCMEPMSNYTSLKIGGPADIFVEPRDQTVLAELYSALEKDRAPFFLLGAGTNILVKDGGIEGVVISMKSFRQTEIIRMDRDYVYLGVEAGVPLQRLVNLAAEKGYAGIEGLTGIPGTVGGALFGNAGAFGYEMKDAVLSIQIMDTGARVKTVQARDIDFSYRGTSIQPHQFILRSEMKLRRDASEGVTGRTQHFLQTKKESQPLWERSAGCVFKNPQGFSAGKLIEEAGCKGLCAGDVEVSSLHANFFINRGHGKAAEFLDLMNTVIQKVQARCGIVLEPEVKIVGRDGIDT